MAPDFGKAAVAIEIRDVLVLKTDAFARHAIADIGRRVWPRAGFHLAKSIAEAESVLFAVRPQLLVTGLEAVDGDLVDVLARWVGTKNWATSILVVTGRQDERTLAVLSALPIAGIFDPRSEGEEEFLTALGEIVRGARYRSRIIAERTARLRMSRKAVGRVLTPIEQVVFAAIGDGSDNAAAARRLDVAETTVASVRRRLHRKLGVQHKGELLALALESGYVRRSHGGGLVQPGFSLLVQAWRKPA